MPKARSGVYSLSIPDGAFGATVTAAVRPVPANGTEDGWDAMWVKVQGFQGGERVYTETLRVVDGEVTLTLGPTPSWDGGPAICHAVAGFFFVNRKGSAELRVEASADFNVL